MRFFWRTILCFVEFGRTWFRDSHTVALNQTHGRPVDVVMRDGPSPPWLNRREQSRRYRAEQWDSLANNIRYKLV